MAEYQKQKFAPVAGEIPKPALLQSAAPAVYDSMFAALFFNATQVTQPREQRALSDHFTRANLNRGNAPHSL